MLVRIALVAALTTMALAADATAQTGVVDTFVRLPEVVKVGTIVMVTDDKGQQTKGKITELSPASLQIVASGWREERMAFSPEHLARVSRVDSRLNGFLIGLAAGAVPGILLGVGFTTYCENESADCPGAPAYFGGAFGLIGGWIGFSIDGAINGQQLVFARAPGPGLKLSFKF